MSAINAGGYRSHSSTVQYKPTTKAALAITFKKIIQYAQAGRTDRDQQYPEAVSWIKARVKDDDTRATPEKVLKEEEYLSLVNYA